ARRDPPRPRLPLDRRRDARGLTVGSAAGPRSVLGSARAPTDRHRPPRPAGGRGGRGPAAGGASPGLGEGGGRAHPRTLLPLPLPDPLPICSSSPSPASAPAGSPSRRPRADGRIRRGTTLRPGLGPGAHRPSPTAETGGGAVRKGPVGGGTFPGHGE